MSRGLQFYNKDHWSPVQKIAFRFFFVFLILQEFFAESVYVLCLGYTNDSAFGIVRVAERIFKAPCLWLNDHLFHFNYVPGWTALTPALETIRDILYLVIACLACIVWTILDRRRAHYNKLYLRFSQIQVILLSFIMFTYGIIKLLPVQMRLPSFTNLQRPIGDLSPFQLIWITLGYGTPYQVFCGFFELLGAVLILFRRTRLAGLLTIAIVLVNVIILNYAYQIGLLVLSFYFLLITLFLLAPYAMPIWNFFFTAKPVASIDTTREPLIRGRSRIVVTASTILISSFFLSHIYYAYDRYATGNSVSSSRQYSLVRSYIVDSDTLLPIENDTCRWRVWDERVMNGKRLVTIHTMKQGSNKEYSLERDSASRHLTLFPKGQGDSSSIMFQYENVTNTTWNLTGTLYDKTIKVALERIDPDTLMRLLKVKRVILPTDDSVE